MELTHAFTVPADIDHTWRLLNDVEQVATCFPGAAVDSAEGDEFSGTVKVKLGPISMQYKGTGTFTQRDEQRYRAVIDAKGKDKRGNGTASATVVATLTADGDGTSIEVATDLAITGKPAQFGRGVIQDVSDKLLDQFVACLSDRLSPSPSPSPSPSAQTVPEAQATPAAPATGPSTGPSTGPTPGSTAPAAGSSGAEIDLGATVLPVIIRRYAPQIAGAFVAILALAWLRTMRKRRKERKRLIEA